MRDRSPFFFIHVYKNLGSSLYSQFPENYNKRFYGKKSLNQWKMENSSTIRQSFKYESGKPGYLDGVTKFAIDHLDLDSCYEIGILDDFDFKWREFIAIVRNPIDRFVSMCNFTKKNPNELLNEFNLNLTQTKPLKTKKKINLTLIQMERPDLITSHFKNFNIHLDLNIRLNESQKKISKQDLTEDQINEYKMKFFDDFNIYQKVLDNDGIIKNFTF